VIPDCDKKIFLVLDGFIYRAEIATDVYTTIGLVFAIKRVVAENGMEWIFSKHAKPFFKFVSLGSSQFDIVLFKIAMKKNFHEQLEAIKIASGIFDRRKCAGYIFSGSEIFFNAAEDGFQLSGHTRYGGNINATISHEILKIGIYDDAER